jgi:hypothetical protein
MNLKDKGSLRRKRVILRKVFAVASIASMALLVSMYCMGPLIFYDDLVMKKEILTKLFKTSESGYMVPFLAVLSMREVPFDWVRQFAEFSRFQAGIIIYISFTAFAWFRVRHGGFYSISFITVSGLILIFALFPQVFRLPILKILDIAQFSYRFLGLLTFAGALMGGLALKDYFSRRKGFTKALKSVAVIILISFTTTFALPYLYPKGFPDSRVWHLNSNEISGLGFLVSNDTNYMRPPPPVGYSWIAPGVKPLSASENKPGEVMFKKQLDDYRQEYGDIEGEVYLDVLYFPGLQDIQVSVDGHSEELELETYWQRRTSVRMNDSDDPGGFHGLKITGVPSKGLLEVRVRFTGMSWANWASGLSLVFLILGSIIAIVKKYNRT